MPNEIYYTIINMPDDDYKVMQVSMKDEFDTVGLPTYILPDKVMTAFDSLGLGEVMESVYSQIDGDIDESRITAHMKEMGYTMIRNDNIFYRGKNHK